MCQQLLTKQSQKLAWLHGVSWMHVFSKFWLFPQGGWWLQHSKGQGASLSSRETVGDGLPVLPKLIDEVASYEFALRERLKFKAQLSEGFGFWCFTYTFLNIPIWYQQMSKTHCGMRHWESLPINVVEQYRSRVEQLSCVLKAFNSASSMQEGGGQGGH